MARKAPKAPKKKSQRPKPLPKKEIQKKKCTLKQTKITDWLNQPRLEVNVEADEMEVAPVNIQEVPAEESADAVPEESEKNEPSGSATLCSGIIAISLNEVGCCKESSEAEVRRGLIVQRYEEPPQVPDFTYSQIRVIRRNKIVSPIALNSAGSIEEDTSEEKDTSEEEATSEEEGPDQVDGDNDDEPAPFKFSTAAMENFRALGEAVHNEHEAEGLGDEPEGSAEEEAEEDAGEESFEDTSNEASSFTTGPSRVRPRWAQDVFDFSRLVVRKYIEEE